MVNMEAKIRLFCNKKLFFQVFFIVWITFIGLSRGDVWQRCDIPKVLHGEWYSRENGYDTYTTITSETMTNKGRCLEFISTGYDNFTILFKEHSCYYFVRIFLRTLNVLEKIETLCITLDVQPSLDATVQYMDVKQELVTLFAKNPTAKNCRSSLEGVWKFDYQRKDLEFIGECKHPESNITACQKPGTQFFIENDQFNVFYHKCEGMEKTYNAEVQYMCLGDWYIGKNHYFAVKNTRESRIDEAYRCFIANRDDDFYLSVSITAECNTLKNPQEGPERLHLHPVKAEYVPPKCKFPDNFFGNWINTENSDSDVFINLTHIVERWKPDQGREKEQIYVCQEQRDTRFVLARMGINGCQNDYICFDFVPRHHNIIRYRTGKAMITDEFSTVCSWVMFPNRVNWRYNLLIAKNPESVKCPLAGKFKFDQRGDILFETRIRGGVTSSPRPFVYCRENISDFSVCDPDQKIIYIDADYCISVDHLGRPLDIYSEPDYKMKCIGFWKENLKSYLITYDEEDAYSKYRCWVYQRADLNRIFLSQSVGAYCSLNQDVSSYSASEGAQVSLSMIEYEREHDDCPMDFDDGTNPYQPTSSFVTILNSSHKQESLYILILFQILLFSVIRRLDIIL